MVSCGGDNLEPFSQTISGDGSATLNFEFSLEFLEDASPGNSL